MGFNETIGKAPKTYDLATIFSEEVTIRSDAAVEAKAGHILFWNATNKGFEAFAVATDIAGETGMCVVLLEDISIPKYTAPVSETPASGEVTAKAIISGVVYKDYIRSAGITEDALPDSAFNGLVSKIIFKGPKEV